jgi:uncharacterized SAM-binding protein YcdF (DUF218 family)
VRHLLQPKTKCAINERPNRQTDAGSSVNRDKTAGMNASFLKGGNDCGDTPPRRHTILRYAAVLLSAGIILFSAGFLLFASWVETVEPALSRHAEGMIALTGGADRITDAVDLFARGHADRLLITGVNQNITRTEISKLFPKFRELVDCCVDLGYDALNTAGNADEARRWVEQRHIGKSLIVVTSNYHMPRALAEMSRALPDRELIPFPVVALRMKDSIWWRNPHVARIMATEYVKYLVAVTRLHLASLRGWTGRQATPTALSRTNWS